MRENLHFQIRHQWTLLGTTYSIKALHSKIHLENTVCETLKILSIMPSMQRIEEHLTSLGKNGAYNEYAAASMKMTRNNVDKITMF